MNENEIIKPTSKERRENNRYRREVREDVRRRLKHGRPKGR